MTCCKQLKLVPQGQYFYIDTCRPFEVQLLKLFNRVSINSIEPLAIIWKNRTERWDNEINIAFRCNTAVFWADNGKWYWLHIECQTNFKILDTLIHLHRKYMPYTIYIYGKYMPMYTTYIPYGTWHLYLVNMTWHHDFVMGSIDWSFCCPLKNLNFKKYKYTLYFLEKGQQWLYKAL